MTTDFKILSDAEHVLLRSGMYIGSTTLEEYSGVLNYEWSTVKIVPGLLKIVNEIIDNGVDEYIRTSGEFANKISISFGSDISGHFVEVSDNGRGIPLNKVGDTYQPVAAWTKARAGSNFSDDRETLGMNGVGSMATSVFSREFIGTTSNGTDGIVVSVRNNCSDISFKLKPVKTKGTTVKFYPDLERFGLTEIDHHHIDYLHDRIENLAICYKGIQFTFNGDKIKFKSLRDIAKKFSEHCVLLDEDKISMIVAPSGEMEEFRALSYINGLNVKNGGTHIDFILNKITDALRTVIKKKYKFDVLPNQIKQHLLLATWVNGFKNLRFDSQSKERCTNTVAEVTAFFGDIDFDAIAKKVINTPEIIDPIVEAQIRKKEAQEAAELRKKNKDVDKANLRKISKFTDATQKEDRENCMLFVCEGDSAASSILSARSNNMGCYPLKGKPINALAATTKELMDNKEFTEMMTILGLKIGEKVTSTGQLRFGKIVVTSDADHDGAHIFGLICASLKKFWPELFSLGMIYRFQTPIMKAMIGKEDKYFYSLDEFTEWEKKQTKSFKTRYLKGLGSSTAEDFRGYFTNMKNNLIKVDIQSIKDLEIVDLVFGKETGAADRRKEWLNIE